MDRIAIHGSQIHFFAVWEDRVDDTRASTENMAIGENDSSIGIDDEPCSLGGKVY